MAELSKYEQALAKYNCELDDALNTNKPSPNITASWMMPKWQRL